MGGLFGIFIGFFFIRYILSPESGLVFPTNYALLFGCAGVAIALSLTAFLQIREPIRPVQSARQPFGQHLKRGPHFFRTDRNYRWVLSLPAVYHSCWNVHPFLRPLRLAELGSARRNDWDISRRCLYQRCHLKCGVGIYRGEIWCTIHPQLHLGIGKYGTVGGNFGAIPPAGVAGALLFPDVCLQRRIDERFVK